MLYPLLAMVALVFALLTLGFVMRFRAVKRREVSMGYFRLLTGDAPMYLQQASRHYSNLFEMPVLFYAAAVICVLYPIEGTAVTALGWAYVIARVFHAAIHLTYNNVLHRALAFQAGNVVLVALWVIIGLTLAG